MPSQAAAPLPNWQTFAARRIWNFDLWLVRLADMQLSAGVFAFQRPSRGGTGSLEGIRLGCFLQRLENLCVSMDNILAQACGGTQIYTSIRPTDRELITTGNSNTRARCDRLQPLQLSIRLVPGGKPSRAGFVAEQSAVSCLYIHPIFSTNSMIGQEKRGRRLCRLPIPARVARCTRCDMCTFCPNTTENCQIDADSKACVQFCLQLAYMLICTPPMTLRPSCGTHSPLTHSTLVI